MKKQPIEKIDGLFSHNSTPKWYNSSFLVLIIVFQ